MKENVLVAVLAGFVGALLGGLMVRHFAPPVPDILYVKEITADVVRVTDELNVLPKNNRAVQIKDGQIDANLVVGRTLRVVHEDDANRIAMDARPNGNLLVEGSLICYGVQSFAMIAQRYAAALNPIQEPKLYGEFVATPNGGNLHLFSADAGKPMSEGNAPPTAGQATILGHDNEGWPMMVVLSLNPELKGLRTYLYNMNPNAAALQGAGDAPPPAPVSAPVN